MKLAELLLLGANVVYATSYVATRVTLGSIPPGALAFARLVIAWAALAPFARPRVAEPSVSPGDRRTIAWMGLLGFAAAYAFSHWGIARSTASNAALLIVVEPLALMLASPIYLGERLSRREAVGAALAVAGTVPVVVAEWASGARPVWTAPAVAGTLYLAVVISALGYVAWNWALARVSAPRAALFLNVQPIAGALLGALLLDEPLTGFTIVGGTAIVAGPRRCFRSRAPLTVYSKTWPSPAGTSSRTSVQTA